jgi:hypothetical protein
MKHCRQPSGLTLGLEFLINDNWTPEQAWAVVELLDDLRERILNHYLIPIQDLLRDDHGVTEELQQGQPNVDDLNF